MLTGLREILAPAREKKFAVPAFNVYNMETVMGVIGAAQELRSPVILQFYSRLATTGIAEWLCPVCLHAAHRATVPVCVHLDHGAGHEAAAIAVRCGATGIMVDFSMQAFDENAENTAKTVRLCNALGIGVEGELGHIGRAADGVDERYTEVKDAVEYVARTQVSALAVQVGTAHGRYPYPPKIAVDRISEIAAATGVPLVLHGGSGIPDEQVRAAVAAGIAKVNFGTDLCYAFLDEVFRGDRSVYAIDLFMARPTQAVRAFAAQKIALLGAEGKA